MSEKTFKIVDGDMSDGYHTFDELYEHRHLLFLNLIKRTHKRNKVYCVEDHFDGWDLIVLELYQYATAEVPYDHPQISYHLPIRLRKYYSDIERTPKSGHRFDGHTSGDVLQRLARLILEA